MNDETAKALMIYISNNLETESSFLSPNPSASVEVIGLLDKIAELRGIDLDSNGKEFNTIHEDYKIRNPDR